MCVYVSVQIKVDRSKPMPLVNLQIFRVKMFPPPFAAHSDQYLLWMWQPVFVLFLYWQNYM